MKTTIPNIQPLLDQFHLFSSKMNPKTVAALSLSAVTVLIFARLSYLKWTGSTDEICTVIRKPSLSRVPTLLRDKKQRFTLVDIRTRTNEFISKVLIAPPELPSGQIRATVVWIKDSFDSIYLQAYCFLFKKTIAADRENIQNLMLKVENLKNVIKICEKHSTVLLDFAIFQSLYSEINSIPARGEKPISAEEKETNRKALEQLCTQWERKGFPISLKDDLDDSYRPLLRSYRDCLLFFAPYISKEEVEKQALLLITTVERSLLKNDPEKAVRFLTSTLLNLYPKGLPNSHPIVKALERLILSINVDLRDLLYKNTIFPLLGKTTEGIVFPTTAKVRQILYRQIENQIGNHHYSPTSFHWLLDAAFISLDNDPTLASVRQLLQNTNEPTLQQLLRALFSQNPESLKEFLTQQMLAAFKQPPTLKKQLLPALKTWNAAQPLLLQPKTLLHAYYIRTEEQFVLSFAAFTDNDFALTSKPIVINTADLKISLGKDFEDNDKLDECLLTEALKAVSMEGNLLKEALEILTGPSFGK